MTTPTMTQTLPPALITAALNARADELEQERRQQDAVAKSQADERAARMAAEKREFIDQVIALWDAACPGYEVQVRDEDVTVDDVPPYRCSWQMTPQIAVETAVLSNNGTPVLVAFVRHPGGRTRYVLKSLADLGEILGQANKQAGEDSRYALEQAEKALAEKARQLRRDEYTRLWAAHDEAEPALPEKSLFWCADGGLYVQPGTNRLSLCPFVNGQIEATGPVWEFQFTQAGIDVLCGWLLETRTPVQSVYAWGQNAFVTKRTATELSWVRLPDITDGGYQVYHQVDGTVLRQEWDLSARQQLLVALNIWLEYQAARAAWANAGDDLRREYEDLALPF